MERVLDLFSGLKGWSQPWKDRGHEVFTVDFDAEMKPDLVADVLDLRLRDFPWRPTVILASPPCEGFSVARMWDNWTTKDEFPPNRPVTATARLGVELVEKTVTIIRTLDPDWFIIENPRSKLRTLGLIPCELREVTYCLTTYGDGRRKPTDLWGGFPMSLKLKPPCAMGGKSYRYRRKEVEKDEYGRVWVLDRQGRRCHIRALRGSDTGTQGMRRDNAARIPEKLATEVMEAVHMDRQRGLRWTDGWV